ncbi:FAD-dependent oxidoreductase [Aestuariivita boseongensis]|uniref:FAD-dependent oxidoreductase n=1 Tax=Aestuariivita boseongensis TaxID=1470562 RepID=UPI0006817643
MSQRIVVIGAGIIGAAIASHLAEAGHDVTVIDRTGPAAEASGRSFGWINASFFADAAHFRLRAAGIDAWRRAGMQDVTWSGSLWFEEDGAGFDVMLTQLQDFNYPVEPIDRDRFCELEPHVATLPKRALRLPSEAAAEGGAVTQGYLARAQASGARALFGVDVLGIDTAHGAVTHVVTSAGALPADQVVVAAGTGTPGIVAPLGVNLSMLRRPGLLITTRAVPPVLSHILIAPGQELRQLPDGRFLAPTSPNHQADDASELEASAQDLAETALARVANLLPDQALSLESITMAFRPVPEDGLPVVGPAGPDGLYIATMHSGMTLAAIIGELVAQELTNGGTADLLAPYRPGRFSA